MERSGQRLGESVECELVLMVGACQMIIVSLPAQGQALIIDYLEEVLRGLFFLDTGSLRPCSGQARPV